MSKDIPVKNIVSVFSLPEAKTEFESPSQNTMIMIVNLSLESLGDFETIPDEVKKLRNIVSKETKSNNNLTVLVGGPGGLFADLIKVFQSIDGLLLTVTVVLVLVLLLIIYKSPVTALLPLIVVGIVFQVSQGIIAWIDQSTGDFLKVNGQSIGIMTVVLFGSGTDYCLFISSRFKEELAKTKDKHEAMKKTMIGVGGAVTSAGFTIIVASSILLLCILKSYQSLGPVIGIAVFLMLIAALTLVPSLMCIMGRFSFFPVNYNKKFKLITFNKKEKANFTYKKKIIIKDLLLNIIIGFYNIEKVKKQNVKFNIELNYTNQKPQNDKDIKSIVNYEKITKIIKNLTKSKHYNFLESLAEDVFDELFKDERINKIRLKIEKLDAIKETASVGIEITKKRIHV